MRHTQQKNKQNIITFCDKCRRKRNIVILMDRSRNYFDMNLDLSSSLVK